MGDAPPIPYGRQWLDDDDIASVVEVLRGDWLTQGPAVQRFEEALASRCGARHAVAVANGSVALHLACMAADLGPGDEGITSPITFLASASCMVHCGARPVFADIDPRTWLIDPRAVEALLSERTRVLIPVSFAGLPCDMEALRDLADRRGLFLIEDACHAIGGRYRDRPVGGGLAHMTCLSFHPVKHVTTGEGGAILTDDDAVAERLRRLRHHGITRDRTLLHHDDGPWYHEAIEIGINGRLSDIQCALGLSQLKKLDAFLARRRVIAERYRTELAHIDGLTLQHVPRDRCHAYHLFVVHLDPALYDRSAVFAALRRRGVAPQVHYIPVHRQPAMRAVAGVQGPLPHAEHYYAGCLTLPMFPALTDGEQGRAIAAFTAALGEGAR